MYSIFKRLLIGKSLKTSQLKHEKFNVIWGLPILSSDAISSVAYAGEEILLVLIPVIGLAAYTNLFYISLAIIFLLCLLVFSYRQTIDSYPNGGGSYIVAKDNLGHLPSLVAGASLSIDYVLTVAVSASSGTAAITSAFSALYPHRVIITVAMILLLTLGNLRGLKDSSKLFGVPTYLFIFSILSMIGTGIFKYYVLGIHPTQVTGQLTQQAGSVSIFLLLKAFSNGCTALTGVEAVSDGIPNFKEPAQKNAKIVLGLLAFLVFIIFGGSSFLATLYRVVPVHGKTVISQIAVAVFGQGFMFYMMQATTALILILAANTAFSDFPLLLSYVSRDGYMPRQLSHRGERLSFSNGIKLLAFAAIILVIIFNSDVHALIPLYAVGVFISFTISQSGMFMRWIRLKSPNWHYKAAVNGTGAAITFITVIIIGVNKFKDGAWIVLILIPVIMTIMLLVKSHYNRVANELSLSVKQFEDVEESEDMDHVIVLVDSLNQASIKAINYGKKISKNIVAFHVSIDEDATDKLKEKWQDVEPGIPLIIKQSPYRDIYMPLREFIDSEEHESVAGELITIIMPQFIVKSFWQNVLHGQTALLLKNKLLRDRHIAVITIPYTLGRK
jgi:amino acid transporter